MLHEFNKAFLLLLTVAASYSAMEWQLRYLIMSVFLISTTFNRIHKMSVIHVSCIQCNSLWRWLVVVAIKPPYTLIVVSGRFNIHKSWMRDSCIRVVYSLPDFYSYIDLNIVFGLRVVIATTISVEDMANNMLQRDEEERWLWETIRRWIRVVL